jgi:multiple sugar transport system substrate-binding protein/sn-glycerol 3-phosphate transport system substrate-binding protein
MYYNLSWLKELGFDGPPKTWAEFAKMCAAATNQAKGTYGYAITTDASDIFSEIASRGGKIAKADGTGYTFNTPEAKAAFAYMQKLYQEGYAKKIAEKYGEQADFANRKVLFTTGTTAGLPYYAKAIEQGSAGTFDWSVAPMPHSTAKPVVNIYGASISVTRSNPEKELASWLFLRWYAEPTQEAQWVRISNYFPSRKSAASELTDYFQQNPKYKDAFDILGNSQSVAEPPFTGYQQVRGLMSTAFNAVLDGANIDQTLAKLETDASKVHKESAP